MDYGDNKFNECNDRKNWVNRRQSTLQNIKN